MSKVRVKSVRDMNKRQLKDYYFFRNRGFSIAEARKTASMTYDQLANALSDKLRRLA